MSGVLNVIAAAGSETSGHALTVGTSGSVAGYSSPSSLNFGSLSPTTVQGATIRNLYSPFSSNDLEVWLEGRYTQDFFTTVIVQDGTGAFRTYASADADLFQNQGDSFTVWGWGDGASSVWETTDATESRSVAFIY